MPASNVAAPTTSRAQPSRRVPRLLAAGAALAMLFTAPGLTGLEPAAAAGSNSGDWWYHTMRIAKAQRMAPSRGSGITIAVMDGLIDPSVPELRGQKVITRNHGYCTGDNNSKPATTNGPESSHATAMTTLMVGNGHGTDGPGTRGIAPKATVRSYVVGLNNDPDDKQRLHCSFGLVANQGDEALAKAINQAVDDGADIISMSIGGYNGSSMEKAVLRAERRGVILVAATDDADSPSLRDRFEPPATYNGVVAVNAVNRKARLAKKSSYADGVSVAAPGVKIGTGGWRNGRWSSSNRYTGSSPATAIVSGSLALVWSHFPKATANQILQVMVHSTGLKKVREKDGTIKFNNGFQRPPERYLPSGQQKNGYGFGIISPADMLRDVPSSYKDLNPVLRNNAGIVPSKHQILRGTKYDPAKKHKTATARPSATHSPAETSASPGTDESAAATSSDDTSGTHRTIIVGGIAIAVVIALLGVVLIRHSLVLKRK